MSNNNVKVLDDVEHFNILDSVKKDMIRLGKECAADAIFSAWVWIDYVTKTPDADILDIAKKVLEETLDERKICEFEFSLKEEREIIKVFVDTYEGELYNAFRFAEDSDGRYVSEIVREIYDEYRDADDFSYESENEMLNKIEDFLKNNADTLRIKF